MKLIIPKMSKTEIMLHAGRWKKLSDLNNLNMRELKTAFVIIRDVLRSQAEIDVKMVLSELRKIENMLTPEKRKLFNEMVVKKL